MTKQAFVALNKRQEEAGEPIYANPRNSAAGSLRQHDPAITASRPLSFFAYAWGEMSEMPAETQCGMLGWFEGCGFGQSAGQALRPVEQVLAFHRDIEEQRAELGYDIDGVVYKVDRLDCRSGWASSRAAPRWAIAHKFPAEQARTVLEGHRDPGRPHRRADAGGRLEPVTVGGVVVRNATLHNEDEIGASAATASIARGPRYPHRRHGGHPARRRRDPADPRVVLEKRPKGAKPYKFPKKCPCPLHTEVVREETATGRRRARRCTGEFVCPSQRIERLKHFVSRRAFDIEGLGEKQIELFHEQGLLKEPADIFTLEARNSRTRWRRSRATAKPRCAT